MEHVITLICYTNLRTWFKIIKAYNAAALVKLGSDVFKLVSSDIIETFRNMFLPKISVLLGIIYPNSSLLRLRFIINSYYNYKTYKYRHNDAKWKTAYEQNP